MVRPGIEESVRALGDYLQGLSIFAQVRDEWPSANMRLTFPCATIITSGKPEFEPLSNYVCNSDAPDVENKVKSRYVVGQYEQLLQLDIWARNKKERATLYESLFQKWHEKNGPLALTLTNYYGILCNYLWGDFSFEDSEISAQRQEWRVKIDILANFKGVVERDEAAMVELPTASEIENEEGSEVSSTAEI